jgi:hypothetical protein
LQVLVKQESPWREFFYKHLQVPLNSTALSALPLTAISNAHLARLSDGSPGASLTDL